MTNERGEVVTGVVMVMMMVGMMIFGLTVMHGGHNHGDDQGKKEQKHEHGAADHDHMNMHMQMQHNATDDRPASSEPVDPNN